MRVERTNSDLRVDELPDGSKVIVDSKSETVFALNATAGAAWDACSQPTTLSEVTKKMQRSTDTRITEDVALAAILQLQEKNLVLTSESSPDLNRRAMLPILSAVGLALPLVVSLTLLEQRAHAAFIHSKP